MKNIFTIIGITILHIVKSAFWAALISGFFCLVKWIGSLLSLSETPTWGNFIGGGIGVFAVLFIHKMFWIIRDMRRRFKDPTYDAAANEMGLSYRDYKRLKEKKDNKKGAVD